ncbi:multidrug efflux pump subunit AcrB [Litoreibacter ponti]|uniref:Multidrug efflux pump subunit AcrB n=1 Tax=Litoreibacter ponti TaxID=1510457 RepID=A0A2T6BMU4_9RHOB|nr:efflux RND transporter permease subunit [Litoreibacter ponti]PTX57389.1 multidrug efflux pump subunit AcrB [Litoreibacter ponti]
MNIARLAIEKQVLSWMIILICLFGGIWGFFSLGRLEDPAFTIKQAIIITEYPGATAAEVAEEVSEPLESAIQKMGELKRVTSINYPGFSRIEIEIKDSYGGDELPAVWTDLRAKVRDAARGLPTGVGEPLVNDSFGDVFGIYYAITAEGFTDAEKHELATFLRRELLTVEGVSDVQVSALPPEVIYVEPDLALTVNQNIAPGTIVNAIANANSVAAAGSIGDTRLQRPEGNDTVSEIEGLSVGFQGEVINLVDVAEVYRGRNTDPSLIMRYNGVEAFTLGIAGLSSENIVDVGNRVDAKLAELDTEIPVGVELNPIYQQHVVVDEASNGFLVNLAMSVGIVVAVLAIAMGWRAAIVVGSTLLLTVSGTMLFMYIFGIEMERISLGALIIAMGMLVDNALVVAEGMQIAMQRGKSSREAADEAAGKTQIPLLGATVIGIMAFAGIGLSPDATGEFLFSLFAVIGISLLLSWVLALTVTPLFSHYFFKQGMGGEEDAYGGPLFRAYGATLRGALKARWLVIPMLVGITAACFWGFGQVKQQFFPDSNTPIFLVHYKLPQGTQIETTSEDLTQVEDWLAGRDDVVSVSTFVGQGAARFILTYAAEEPDPSYGHMLIRTETLEQIPPLAAALEDFAVQALPAGLLRTRRLVFGPGGGDPIEVRVSGSDPDVLREISERVIDTINETSDTILHARTNWYEPQIALRPIYAVDRAQTAGINREDVATATLFATDGISGGVYREGDRQIPIIVRAPREADLTLSDQVIFSEGSGTFIPLEQVIDGYSYEVENTVIHRRDRLSTITVAGNIPSDITAADARAGIVKAIEAIEVPIGYQLEWGGEFESSGEAQASLGQQLPLSFLIMLIISILLFMSLRQPLIIWLLVPMSVNGVVIGLLITGFPFSFTALLGLLSLSGMLIKNGIVLVEEIDIVRREGRALFEAIVEASTSRLRPVMLAAATTIMGMIPLLGDAFFKSMAVTIMGGLAFATILTLIAAPTFYYVLFRRDEAREQEEGAEPAAA